MKLHSYIFILFCLLFNTTFLFGQWEGDYTFEWEESPSTTGDTIISCNYSTNEFEEDLPVISIMEPIQLSKLQSIEIIDVTYIPLSAPYKWVTQFASTENKDININGNIECARSDCNLILDIDPIYIEEGEMFLVATISIKVNLDEKVIATYDYKEHSILSNGNNYSLKIKDHGMYKITRSFLNDIGLSDAISNPKTIKIFSAGGEILPGPVDEFRIDDYEEIPLIYEGLEDGTLDAGDAIMFYAEGPDDYRVSNGQLLKNKNPFLDDIQYILKYGGSEARQIQVVQSSETPEITTDQGLVAVQHERDEVNMLNLLRTSGFAGGGRQWYGEQFTYQDNRNFSLDLATDEIVTAEAMVEFVGRDNTQQDLSITINGIKKNFSVGATRDLNGDVVGKSVRASMQVEINKTADINISYNGQQGAIGLLNFISLNYEAPISKLKPGTIFTAWANIRDEKSIAFTIDPDMLYLDISSPVDYFIASQSNEKVILPHHPKARLINIKDGAYATLPEFNGLLNQQDLHAMNVPDMLIITVPEFYEEALRLATHRNSFSGIESSVITIEEIAHEYGRGSASPIAIRDFVKQLYERSPRLKYLLLFGDGTFDYRNILGHKDFKYTVPSFQTHTSLDYLDAFPSDDYFGLLNNNEGGLYDQDIIGSLDIAIGRLPANSIETAKGIVDKIIFYDKDLRTKGDWKLRASFIGDDEDGSSHIKQSNNMADYYTSSEPNFNAIKILSDAFVQESSAGGDRYPEATKKFIDNLYRGVSVVNYLGHGSPVRWGQEKLFTLTDVLSLDNYETMPLFITATCTYAPYDNPFFTSSGEHLILNERGGAIALFSTLRPVYQSHNEKIVSSVMNSLTNLPPENLQFGEILRDAKNSRSGSSFTRNSRKFVLLGDPSQRLSIPTQKIKLDKINDINASEFQDTVKALSKLTLEGHIEDNNGSMTDFNGELQVTFYDKKEPRKTLGQDPSSKVYSFFIQESAVYKGKASVVNGKFQIEFIVPKDINYQFGDGKLSLYAYDKTTMLEAMGNKNDILIGGIKDIEVSDVGPQISLFLDDTLFVNGDKTSKNPTLLAFLEDDLGISVSGQGIGHDLIAFIDGNEKNQLILNDYYSANLNDYTSGQVTYRLDDLTPGEHTLTLRAWDLANNVAEETISFIVSDETEIEISKAIAYPNPFSDQCNFIIKHNKARENIDVEVHVHDTEGKLLYSITKNYPSAPSMITDISWDGANSIGIGKTVNNLYFVTVSIRLNSDIKSEYLESKSFKLLNIN